MGFHRWRTQSILIFPCSASRQASYSIPDHSHFFVLFWTLLSLMATHSFERPIQKQNLGPRTRSSTDLSHFTHFSKTYYERVTGFSSCNHILWCKDFSANLHPFVMLGRMHDLKSYSKSCGLLFFGENLSLTVDGRTNVNRCYTNQHSHSIPPQHTGFVVKDRLAAFWVNVTSHQPSICKDVAMYVSNLEHWNQTGIILLMEEILHHLGCIKPCK